MKLVSQVFISILLISTTSILSMEHMSDLQQETSTLHKVITEYQKTQDHEQQFRKEWCIATANNVCLIYRLAGQTQIEYLGQAIKSLCCLPEAAQADSQTATINSSVINYRNKALEIVKGYEKALYLKAQSELASRPPLHPNDGQYGAACLTDLTTLP